MITVNSPADASGMMMGVAPARGTVDTGLLEAGRLLEAAGYARRSFTENGPASYARDGWLVELSRYAGFGDPLVGYRIWKTSGTTGGGGTMTVDPPAWGGNGGVAGP